MCFITSNLPQNAIRQLVVIELAKRVYFAVIAPPVKTLISVRASLEKFLLSSCIFAPNVPSMLRRLRTVTRARLMLDVEGRIHLRSFPAFYFNDKNTTALSMRANAISKVGGGGVLHAKISRNSSRLRDES